MTTLPDDLAAALTTFARRSRVLVAADFDGTLAPLTDDPMASRAVPGAMDLLRQGAGMPGVSVALVSGRDLESLAALSGVTEDEAIVLVGSHGAQTSLAADLSGSLLNGAQQRLLATLGDALEDVAAGSPGARVEHKPAAAVLHTRGMPADAASEASAAAEAVAGRHGDVHVTRGHDIVELSVVGTTKGDAIRILRGSVQAEAVAYFGDDVTDERAFQVLDWVRGDVRVKVGPADTVAEHRLAEPADVVTALRFFVDARVSS